MLQKIVAEVITGVQANEQAAATKIIPENTRIIAIPTPRPDEELL